MATKKTKKPQKPNTKDYQFTVRVPSRMRDLARKRYQSLGYNQLAEYIRFLIIQDIDGFEGEHYGQTV